MELSLGMWSGHCSKGVQSLLLLPCAAGTGYGMEKPGDLPQIPGFPSVPASARTLSLPEEFLEVEKAPREEMFSVPAPCSSPRSALSSFVGGIPRFLFPGHLGGEGRGQMVHPSCVSNWNSPGFKEGGLSQLHFC